MDLNVRPSSLQPLKIGLDADKEQRKFVRDCLREEDLVYVKYFSEYQN